MQTKTDKRLSDSRSASRKLIVLGQEITVRLTCRETRGEYCVFEAVTPPGIGVPLHVHRQEDEFLRVLDGEFEYQLDQQILKASPGGMVTFPKNVPHAFRNVGTKLGRTFWTVMPGVNFEKFLEELGSLPAAAEPDSESVMEVFDRHDIQILTPRKTRES